MTPPKVDISALRSIQLGNLDGLGPKEKAALFRDTDLIYNPQTDDVESAATPGKHLGLDVDKNNIVNLLGANTNKDAYLDISEIRSFINSHLPPETAATVDPQQFGQNLEKLMKDRYRPLAKNFESFKGQLAFSPTIDALKYYNEGLKSEGFRHANSVLPVNGLLTKSPLNIVLSPWSAVRGLVGKKTEDSIDPNNQALVGDKWAMETAIKNYEKRAAAINKLEVVIQEGIAKNEKWAQEVNIDEALKKLDPESAKLLTDELAAKQLHTIMTTEDDKKRFDEMKKFADKERPGVIGLGTGNTSAGWFNANDLWNISGHRHNTVFARTMYHFLASKAKSGDAEYDAALQREARLSLKDSTGDLGGFNNLASIGLTAVGCTLAYPFVDNMDACITDYRDWGDEEILDGFGRSLDGAIMLFGVNEFWNRGSQFRKLRGLMSDNALQAFAGVKQGEDKLSFLDSVRAYGAGWQGAVPVWWAGAKTARPWPSKALHVFGNNAKYTEAIAEAEALAGGKPVSGWFGRKLSGLFKDLPELRPEQRALLAKSSAVAQRGFDFTKVFCIIGIAAMADEKLSPPYEPFSIDRQVDFDRYPDPTQAPIVGDKK